MIINLLTATGDELDRAGAMHEKKRRDGESDDSYRRRLIDETPADGGPAFGEFKQVGECSIKTGGITVRDYFAAKAMQAIFSNEFMVQRHRDAAKENSIGEDVLVATSAYATADAMISERSK